MAKFRRIPTEIEAEQFFYDKPCIPGVFYPAKQDGVYVGDAFVITMHDQRVYLQNGDWVVPESDGEHYYPIKDQVFRATYTAVAEAVR